MEAHFGSLEELLAELLAGWMAAGWLADGLGAAGWEACRILGDPRLRAPTKWRVTCSSTGAVGWYLTTTLAIKYKL